METMNIHLNKIDTEEFKYQEFYLLKDNNIYKILLMKNISKISISSGNYSCNYNSKGISSLFINKFSSLNEAYNFLIDLFEDNNVKINNKIKYKEITLNFTLNNEKSVEIKLKYEENYQNNFIDANIKELKNEIKRLKEKNNKLEEEIKKIKQNNNSNSNLKPPANIKLLYSIEEKAYADYGLDNTFVAFNSFNNILYLVYSTRKKSIICYDIKNKTLISEMKNCHLGYITSLRHFADKIKKIDIIMSISNEENNIKLWNIQNMTCMLNLINVNRDGFLYSACFLSYNYENFIVTSNYDEFGHSEHLKIFNFKGQKIKEIKKSNEPTFIVECYFDNIFSCQNYIITGNLNYIKSYNYEKNELYHKYFDGSINGYHYSIIIHNHNSVIKLMESCEDGNVRIWHFHGGLLLMRIKVSKENINGLSLYNDKYIFVASDEQNIKLVDLEEESIIKDFYSHSNEVLNLKIIYHPKYGNILISQAYEEDQIKIWSIDN